MVSDNLEFRFLNTDAIRSYLLTNSLVQGKDLYKNIQFLESKNPISIADSPDKIPVNGETWIIGGTAIPIQTTAVDGEALKMYQDLGYGGLKDSKDYIQFTPYSITLAGDYSKQIQPLDVIRVKNATTVGVNGEYHVLNVAVEGNHTVVYVVESITQTSNEGELYYATYESWRKGGPDNFAEWKRELNGWTFSSLSPGNVVTVQEPIHSTYLYTADFSFDEYTLRLPLNMKLKVFVDKWAVTRYNIDLAEERETMKLEIAKYLQLYMTGTDIVYYPSQIIEYVSEPRRKWLKGMYVVTTDSTEPKPFEFKNGIEALPERKIRDNISDSKIEILRYGSAFYWWNVDGIEIEYEIEAQSQK